MHYPTVYTNLSGIRAIGTRKNPNKGAFTGTVIADQTNDLYPADA